MLRLQETVQKILDRVGPIFNTVNNFKKDLYFNSWVELANSLSVSTVVSQQKQTRSYSYNKLTKPQLQANASKQKPNKSKNEKDAAQPTSVRMKLTADQNTANSINLSPKELI